jgi:hypothetical protein
LHRSPEAHTRVGNIGGSSSLDDIDIAQSFFEKYATFMKIQKHEIIFPEHLFSQRIGELYQDEKGDFSLMRILEIKAEEERIRFNQKMDNYNPVENLFKRKIIN